MRMFVCFVVSVLFFTSSFPIQVIFAGEGHDAGYEWAAKHGIEDTGYSNGKSESFNEGVRQYAEEQQSEN